jgi:hypothetical protein
MEYSPSFMSHSLCSPELSFTLGELLKFAVGMEYGFFIIKINFVVGLVLGGECSYCVKVAEKIRHGREFRPKFCQ